MKNKSEMKISETMLNKILVNDEHGLVDSAAIVAIESGMIDHIQIDEDVESTNDDNDSK